MTLPTPEKRDTIAKAFNAARTWYKDRTFEQLEQAARDGKHEAFVKLKRLYKGELE